MPRALRYQYPGAVCHLMARADRWSSLPSHARGRGPDWLETGRFLRAFELAGDGRGRRAYVAWLEARAACEGGKIDEKAMKALRRGWYLGEAGFGDRLLDMFRKPSAGKSRVGGAPKAHGEAEAERLAVEALARVKLPKETHELGKLRKGDGRKVLVACLVRQRTAAGNPWIARRLAMGHSGSVSRLVTAAAKHPPTVRELEKLGKMLKCET